MQITRRHFLIASAGAGLAAAGAALLPGMRRKRPNIILLLADDMRYDAFGAAGNPLIHTPALDALAQESLRFTNHFVTTSICPTSRASIALGQYASRHGIWNFNTALSEPQRKDMCFAHLQRAGYHTGFIGKWGIGPTRDVKGEFNVWNGFAGQGTYYDPKNPQEHLTARQGRQAMRFLQQAPEDKPFALMLSFKAPHGPMQPSSRFAAQYAGKVFPRMKTDTGPQSDIFHEPFGQTYARSRYLELIATEEAYQSYVRSYYELISEMDAVIGVITAKLKRSGLYDNTAILFSSDNGMMLGEHGQHGKFSMFEESIRVPLLVKPARGGWQPGTREEMTLNIDLAPTLLEMAGLDAPPSMQGASLLPLCQNRAGKWRDRFFYEHRFGDWEHLRSDYGIPVCQGVRHARWKYARYDFHQKTQEFLYDLAEDPLEERNLAVDEAHASSLQELRNETEALRKAVT